jgi:hypothetical protein
MRDVKCQVVDRAGVEMIELEAEAHRHRPGHTPFAPIMEPSGKAPVVLYTGHLCASGFIAVWQQFTHFPHQHRGRSQPEVIMTE